MTRVVVVLLAVLLLALWWKWPRLSAMWRKRVLPMVGAALLAFGYAVWPFDVLPDIAPIGLLDDLLVLIATGLWLRQQWRERARPVDDQPDPPRAETSHERWDPYRVLEVQRGASRSEIAHAYREQMKRYHPDRVNGLGPELQRLAHRKTLEIQRAYRELNARG